MSQRRRSGLLALSVVLMVGLSGLCHVDAVKAQDRSNCAGAVSPTPNEVPPGVNDPQEYLQEKAQCEALQAEIERRQSLSPDQLNSLPDIDHGQAENCLRFFATHHFPQLPASNAQTLPQPIAIPTPPPPSNTSPTSNTLPPVSSPLNGTATSPLHIQDQVVPSSSDNSAVFSY